MIDVHGATVLQMWAAGGLLFLWVTTRRREVGLGYGWTMRLTYIGIAAIGLVTGLVAGPHWPRELAALGMIGASAYALLQSVQRRSAGVAGQRRVVERRSARVAAMISSPIVRVKAFIFSGRFSVIVAMPSALSTRI